MPTTILRDIERLWMAHATHDPIERCAEADMAELENRLREIGDCRAAAGLLNWDQATYMPKGGAADRARQRGTLNRLVHEKSIDPELGKLLDRLAPHGEAMPYDSDVASLIRVARRKFEKAIKVPAGHVARIAAFGSAAYDAWCRARPANDFASMAPILRQGLELSREYAEFFAPTEHIADPLIDEADEGMTVAAVQDIFAGLRRELVPIAKAISEQPLADDGCLTGTFPAAEQLAFGREVIGRIGYDLNRGRLDTTAHPFCSRVSAGDVRITTRVYEDEIGQALFSTLHEAGHGLYEQGVSPALDGTPLARGTSAGVHESQSRLWENVVGRSRGFWAFFFPKLQATFPDHFADVSADAFYRAINKVERTLIRTDADEVTYNLHIMMRFDLEIDMLEGRLAIEDLPEAWNARMLSDLGRAPTHDRDGCLQDVHWFSGRIGGGFQGYTIGNILSSQFYAAAVAARPGIPGEIAAGAFGPLASWLRDNIYRHGSKFTPDELVARVTGGPLSTAPYLNYIRDKYGDLYDLP